MRCRKIITTAAAWYLMVCPLSGHDIVASIFPDWPCCLRVAAISRLTPPMMTLGTISPGRSPHTVIGPDPHEPPRCRSDVEGHIGHPSSWAAAIDQSVSVNITTDIIGSVAVRSAWGVRKRPQAAPGAGESAVRVGTVSGRGFDRRRLGRRGPVELRRVVVAVLKQLFGMVEFIDAWLATIQVRGRKPFSITLGVLPGGPAAGTQEAVLVPHAKVKSLTSVV